MAGIPLEKFAYPEVLKDRDWQKKKGKLAKLHKTGLGEALRAAEAVFKKIDSTVLDPASNPSKTMEELDRKVKVARAYYAKMVPPVQAEMVKVQKAAKAAETKLGKKAGCGKAAKAAGAIAKQADLFKITCKSLDLDASIDKVKGDINKKLGLAMKELKPSIKKFLIGGTAYLSSPGRESWGKNVKQQGRSVSNCVKMLPNYNKKFWSEFVKFKGFDLGTLKLNDDEEKSEQLRTAIVKKALQQTKLIAAFKG